MSTSTSTKQPPPNVQGQSAVEQKEAEAFVKLISTITKDKGYESIKNMVSEMKTLREDKEQLTNWLEEAKKFQEQLLDANQEVRNKKQAEKDLRIKEKQKLEKSELLVVENQDKFQKAVEEVQKLEMELKANNKLITEHMKSLKQMEEQLMSAEKTKQDLEETQADRDRIKHQYDKASQELAGFKERFLPLKKVESNTDLKAINETLRALFKEAQGLVHDRFGQLVLQPQVMRGRPWQNFTKHGSLTEIPLPPSNSEAARQMRAAALLRLIADAACKHVFQPVYLAEHGSQVAEILAQINTTLDGQWVRSVLLNIDREGQSVNASKRTDAAIEEVVDLVGPLISSPEDKQAFDTAVSQWYQKACKEWMTLQLYEHRLEAHFEPRFNAQGLLLQWAPLPGLLPKGKSSIGSSAKPRPEPQAHLVMEDIATKVWPEFLATDHKDECVCLSRGHMLLRAQTAAADQEAKEAAQAEQVNSSHGAGLGKQRMINKMISGSKNDLSFLYQKG